MQLGLTYRISKGASRNSLSVKDTFKVDMPLLKDLKGDMLLLKDLKGDMALQTDVKRKSTFLAHSCAELLIFKEITEMLNSAARGQQKCKMQVSGASSSR